MILITGFEPFNKRDENASQMLVKTLYNIEGVQTLILPVVFEECFVKFHKHQNKTVKYVIHIGESSVSSKLQFERVANNVVDFSIEDNSGNKIENSKIYEDGEEYYISNIDVDELLTLDLDVESAISVNAGTFVCNELYYRSLEYFDDKEVASTFIHIPSSLTEDEDLLAKYSKSFKKIISYLEGLDD